MSGCAELLRQYQSEQGIDLSFWDEEESSPESQSESEDAQSDPEIEKLQNERRVGATDESSFTREDEPLGDYSPTRDVVSTNDHEQRTQSTGQESTLRAGDRNHHEATLPLRATTGDSEIPHGTPETTPSIPIPGNITPVDQPSDIAVRPNPADFDLARRNELDTTGEAPVATRTRSQNHSRGGESSPRKE